MPEVILVHVVVPDGTRYEFPFPSDTPPEKILAGLKGAVATKRLMGYAKTVMKKDKVFGEVVPHPDKEAGFAIDHPDTTVLIGHEEEGRFVQDKQIAGPAPKADPPAKPEAHKPSKPEEKK